MPGRALLAKRVLPEILLPTESGAGGPRPPPKGEGRLQQNTEEGSARGGHTIRRGEDQLGEEGDRQQGEEQGARGGDG